MIRPFPLHAYKETPLRIMVKLQDILGCLAFLPVIGLTVPTHPRRSKAGICRSAVCIICIANHCYAWPMFHTDLQINIDEYLIVPLVKLVGRFGHGCGPT